METKEQLVNNIKEWIKMDNEISTLQKEMKERKDKKKTLSEGLLVTMKKKVFAFVKFRNDNGENYRYLTNLLLKYRGTVEYNEKKLQNDKSNTCGKWVIYRFLRNDLTLEQFQNLFSKNTQRNDNIILNLFS
jgi:hypothetical protein